MATRDTGSLRQNFFHYDPLDTHQPSGAHKEFRILTILPGAGDDELNCRLKHYPLPEKIDEPASIEYEALSWTWGDAEERLDSIVIKDDGPRGNREFAVRPNLKHALKSLRYKTEPREMWVDFVCIDQQNFVERAAQVKLMFFIYGKATNVCVWLGKHDNNSEMAVEFVKKEVNDLSSWSSITVEQSKDKWASLVALMNRPWFSRRWVVQELALADKATVHCEDMVMDWTEFETAVALFDREAPRLAGFYQGSREAQYDHELFGDVPQMGATRLVHLKSNLFRLDENRHISEYRSSLHELVSNLWSFEAQDPHDVIYAILSIAKDTHHRVNLPPQEQEQNTPSTENPPESPATMAPSPLTGESERRGRQVVGILRERVAQRTIFNIDYKQPFFLVCKQFLRFAIPGAQHHNLDILLRPWSPAKDKDGNKLTLPSWIPTVESAAYKRQVAKHAPGGFQMRRRSSDSLVAQISHGPRSSPYNASQSPNAIRDEWKMFEGANDFRFLVTGFVIDCIDQIQDASQKGAVPQEWLELGGWDTNASNVQSTQTRDNLDHLWRTLVGDRGPEGRNTMPYYRKACEYAIADSTDGIDTSLLKTRGHPVLEEFLRRVDSVVRNRKLFKSAWHKALGLAPKSARDGDYICIIKGMSVPAILRPVQENGESYYTLVGECYLHTFMDGKAIDVQSEQKTQLEEQKTQLADQLELSKLQNASNTPTHMNSQRSKRLRSPTPSAPASSPPEKRRKTKTRATPQPEAETANTTYAPATPHREGLQQEQQRKIDGLAAKIKLVSWHKFELR